MHMRWMLGSLPEIRSCQNCPFCRLSLALDETEVDEEAIGEKEVSVIQSYEPWTSQYHIWASDRYSRRSLILLCVMEYI